MEIQSIIVRPVGNIMFKIDLIVWKFKKGNV